MATADAQDHPLAIALGAAVPLWIAEIKARGGPTEADYETTREFAWVLGS